MALPTSTGASAHRVIDELASEHAIHAVRIRVIGGWLLGRASHGLRAGRLGRTYDLSFVGPHGAFASIMAALRKWNTVAEGKLPVDARFDLPAVGLRVFALKDWGGERG